MIEHVLISIATGVAGFFLGYRLAYLNAKEDYEGKVHSLEEQVRRQAAHERGSVIYNETWGKE